MDMVFTNKHYQTDSQITQSPTTEDCVVQCTTTCEGDKSIILLTIYWKQLVSWSTWTSTKSTFSY